MKIFQILELIALIVCGYYCGVGLRGNIQGPLQSLRDRYKANECAHCCNDCLATFKGSIIVCIGLNNALKAGTRSFRNQNITELMTELESTLTTRAPKAKIVYVSPISVRVANPNSIYI